MEILLDKIRVSESIKTASKTPSSRRWVYQCRCWFALASGYDWSSLGGQRKITWTVITNKFGVEKQKKFCVEKWFFWVNFRAMAKRFFEEIGEIRFNSVNSRKKCSINRKIWQSHKPPKMRKKMRKEKTLIIFVSGIPGTNISPLTKPASILVSSYKSFVFVSNY